MGSALKEFLDIGQLILGLLQKGDGTHEVVAAAKLNLVKQELQKLDRDLDAEIELKLREKFRQ